MKGLQVFLASCFVHWSPEKNYLRASCMLEFCLGLLPSTLGCLRVGCFGLHRWLAAGILLTYMLGGSWYTQFSQCLSLVSNCWSSGSLSRSSERLFDGTEFSPDIIRAMSSAYMYFFDWVFGRSDVCRLNRRGASTEPCGTPFLRNLCLLLSAPTCIMKLRDAIIVMVKFTRDLSDQYHIVEL